MNDVQRRPSPAIARILERDPPRLGPFRIVAELGEGGFAPVFAAVEEHAGVELRTVALKLFATAQVASADQILDEARALCRVEHPNVVRFLQLVTGDAVIGIAMEHVRGRSVEARILEEVTLPVDVTLEIGVAVATALACVHASGIVHRDVKPANVIDANGVYKLIDFGIAARVRGPSAAASTAALPTSGLVRTGRDRTGEVDVATGDTLQRGRETVTDSRATFDEGSASAEGPAGTMGYIDPVCLASHEHADRSSDLYALGATLYECLTGRLPASKGPGEESSKLHLPIALGMEPAIPLAELAPHVPAEVARLVDSLVAPRREDRPKRAEWVASELERLRRLRRGERRALPAEGPFRGLSPFDAEHRDVYFGRQAELATALEVLRVRGVLALAGPSGSGKSSLARAAVLPAIADGALGAWPKEWTAIALSPGAAPMQSVQRALAPVLDDADRAGPEELADRLAERVDASGIGLVILIDALEEVVTLGGIAEAAELARFVAAISASPRPGVRLVVTLRRDFLDPLLAIATWGSALTRGAVLVSPLSPRALADVLDDRLAAYGYALEDDAMRADLAAQLGKAAESMPLVEFALARLWRERDEVARRIPRVALERIGGVAGALQQHAESVIASLDPAAVRELLVALTTPRGTRARRSRTDLLAEVRRPSAAATLDALERARLVVLDDRQLTLAHDALIAEWPRLRAWVAALERDRVVAEEVETAAARWKTRRGTDALLRGATLATAREVARSGHVRLSDDARRFVSASRSFELRSIVGVASLVSAVAIGGLVLGGLYLRAARETEDEKRVAHAVAQTMLSARNTTDRDRAREVAKLITEKTACEKDRDRLRDACGAGDAGAR